MSKNVFFSSKGVQYRPTNPNASFKNYLNNSFQVNPKHHLHGQNKLNEYSPKSSELSESNN